MSKKIFTYFQFSLHSSRLLVSTTVWRKVEGATTTKKDTNPSSLSVFPRRSHFRSLDSIFLVFLIFPVHPTTLQSSSVACLRQNFALAPAIFSPSRNTNTTLLISGKMSRPLPTSFQKIESENPIRLSVNTRSGVDSAGGEFQNVKSSLLLSSAPSQSHFESRSLPVHISNN